jgi:hypothetical protein
MKGILTTYQYLLKLAHIIGMVMFILGALKQRHFENKEELIVML